MTPREQVESVIYRSCMTLDAADFDGYINLCDDDYHYRISAYSPEIRKDMIWLEHDKDGMSTLFKQLPRHNSDKSPLSRHATIYSVEFADGDKEANVVSFLQVFKTALDGGTTELYAVGKMYDKVKLNGKGATLVNREVKLDTRQLGIGHHVPF